MTHTALPVFTQLNADSQATPLVMLHGWMQASKALEPLGELLSTDRPIILIDLPGFGESPAPTEAQGTDWYKDQVIALLDQEKIERFHLFGHSFGGRIAVQIAAHYPGRVDRLILNAAHGLVRQRSMVDKTYFKMLATLRWLYKTFDAWIPRFKIYERFFIPRFASRDYKDAGVMRKVLVKTVNEDLQSLAAKINRPCLLLWGTEDGETPLSMGEQYHKLIQQSSLIRLTGHGHMPYEDVGAHLLFHYIAPFLSQQESI